VALIRLLIELGVDHRDVAVLANNVDVVVKEYFDQSHKDMHGFV
jgi:hypothetical protein